MALQRFNPLTNAEKLKSLGLDSKIANEIAQQQIDLLNNDLPTKKDLDLIKKDIDLVNSNVAISTTELKTLLASIETKMAELETRLYRNMFTMFVAFGFIQHFMGGK